MVIYDSAKKKKVEFKAIKNGEVRIYVCGPTVYDDAHLGHAKSSVSFDLLRRVFMALNYKVKFVKNFTDIDDKILKKMVESGKNLEEITSFYIQRYLDDMDKLNVLRADIEPKATQNLQEVISYIEILLKKDIAYRLDDGIYFDTTKDKSYLTLSQKNSDLENIPRVILNENKKNDKDFVLWKFDEKWYESPFGKGRPGWHTECVAMIKKHLAYDTNPLIDIHAGGMDLLFPHHENEAAQCRCVENKILAKYWMHNGFVQVNNEKMSKSLGNSFFIKDALNIVCGEVLRFYLISTHYRANFNYSIEDLSASKKRLDKIYRLKKRVLGVIPTNVDEKFKIDILNALSDDLNSSLALATLDIMVNTANEYLDKNSKDKIFKATILANLNFVGEILGILQMDTTAYFQFGVDDKTRQNIENLLLQRDEAKKEKNYQKADEIRQNLLNLGISIMDTPNGAIWEKL